MARLLPLILTLLLALPASGAAAGAASGVTPVVAPDANPAPALVDAPAEDADDNRRIGGVLFSTCGIATAIGGLVLFVIVISVLRVMRSR